MRSTKMIVVKALIYVIYVLIIFIVSPLWAEEKIRLYLTGPFVPGVITPTLSETPEPSGQQFQLNVPAGISGPVNLIWNHCCPR